MNIKDEDETPYGTPQTIYEGEDTIVNIEHVKSEDEDKNYIWFIHGKYDEDENGNKDDKNSSFCISLLDLDVSS